MIADLKSLERLLKLCRKQGVTEIVWEGLSLKFGAEAQPDERMRGARRGATAPVAVDPGEGTYVPGLGIVPPDMTPEQFMFMSSPGPQPSEG